MIDKKENPQLGSEEIPITSDPAGHKDGICFSCKWAGVRYYVDFHDVNGLKISARASKGKSELKIEAKQNGSGLIITVK